MRLGTPDGTETADVRQTIWELASGNFASGCIQTGTRALPDRGQQRRELCVSKSEPTGSCQEAARICYYPAGSSCVQNY